MKATYLFLLSAQSHSVSLAFLSGIFPQDEYPDEVSTDEDDDMFGTRKRMKRGRSRVEDEDEGVPAAKKTKGISCTLPSANAIFLFPAVGLLLP